MIDPVIAHRIDARVLLGLLPHVDQSHLHEIRQQFGAFLSTPGARRSGLASWQAAWNHWSGATPARPGAITYTPSRCGDCRGRRFSTRNIGRNIARTGSPTICGTCSGSGRGQRTRQVARFVAAPDASEPGTMSPAPNI